MSAFDGPYTLITNATGRVEVTNAGAVGINPASGQTITSAQTWTVGGTTYTGIQLTVTDTASAAASLLMNLIVGAASRFQVSKAGQLALPTQGATGGLLIGGDATLYRSAANTLTTGGRLAANEVQVGNTEIVLIRSANYTMGISSDIAFTRTGYSSLVATYAPAGVDQNGTSLTLAGGQSTGAGVGGSIIFRTSPAAGTGAAYNAAVTRLTLDSPGNLTHAAVWNAGGTTFTAYQLTVTDTASAAASLLMNLIVGAASQFSVTKGGVVTAVGYVRGNGGLYAGGDPAGIVGTFGIGITNGIGDAVAANLQAPGQGTGSGPASMTVNQWIRAYNGAAAGWIPFFV